MRYSEMNDMEMEITAFMSGNILRHFCSIGKSGTIPGTFLACSAIVDLLSFRTLTHR